MYIKDLHTPLQTYLMRQMKKRVLMMKTSLYLSMQRIRGLATQLRYP